MTIDILRKPDKIQFVCAEKTVFAAECSEIGVAFADGEKGIKVSVSGKGAISYVKLRWSADIPGDVRVFGDAFERGYGNLEFRGIVPERIMPWYCVITREEENVGCGVRVRPNAFCFWQVDTKGVNLWLDLRCGSEDYMLDGTLDICEIVTIKAQGDAFSFIKALCEKMSDSPLSVDEPVYGSNNWYYSYGNSSAEQIISDTKLLSSLTEGLENRPYMVIDDGWQLGSTSGQCTGTMHCVTNHKFPDMKALADAITDAGAKPGLWLRPLKFNPEQKHENLTNLRDDTYIDPSCEETLDIIATDLEKATGEWGFRLIKFDFATYDVLGKFHGDAGIGVIEGQWRLRNNMTNAQAIKGMYKTIYEHSNGAVIIGCNCIGHLGSGYFHIHRSGDDTSGYFWERTRKMGINTLAFRLPQHKAFFEVDADCVGILGKNIDWQLNSQWLDLLANSGTPLFVSAQPEAMTDEIKLALKEAFKKASKQKDTCEPVDIFTTCPNVWRINGEERTYDFNDIMGADRFGV